MLSVMSALDVTSRIGDERRELQVTPGVPAQPLSHSGSLCLAGIWSWVQRVRRNEWPVKLASKPRRRKSRINPCICSWLTKWHQHSLVQETGPGSVCSLPGLVSMAKSLIFRSHNQMQSRAGSQPSAIGRSSQKGREKSEEVACS